MTFHHDLKPSINLPEGIWKDYGDGETQPIGLKCAVHMRKEVLVVELIKST